MGTEIMHINREQMYGDITSKYINHSTYGALLNIAKIINTNKSSNTSINRSKVVGRGVCGGVGMHPYLWEELGGVVDGGGVKGGVGEAGWGTHCQDLSDLGLQLLNLLVLGAHQPCTRMRNVVHQE